jgi:hypothetical protein
MNGSTAQGVDQTLKGGLLGLFTYAAHYYDLDPGFVAAAMPVLAGVLAWLSSKLGDPHRASFVPTKDKPADK